MSKLELIKKDLQNIEKELGEYKEVEFSREDEQVEIFIRNVVKETEEKAVKKVVQELECEWDTLKGGECISSSLRDRMKTLFYGAMKPRPDRGWQTSSVGELCLSFRTDGITSAHENGQVQAAIEKAKAALQKNKK